MRRACTGLPHGPAPLDRLLDELPLAGVEQVVVVSPFPEVEGPHRLAVPRGDWRGRVSDYLAGAEAAALRSAVASPGPFRCLFVVCPAYNPVGPLDMAGCYDERSDRFVTLGELMDRGYQDAYRQFIDPVVGASGERLEIGGARRREGPRRRRMRRPRPRPRRCRLANARIERGDRQMKPRGLSTELIHRGEDVPVRADAVGVPIYETTTFLFENADEVRRYQEGKVEQVPLLALRQPDGGRHRAEAGGARPRRGGAGVRVGHGGRRRR